MSMQKVQIDRLGAKGDGIAVTEHGPVYVPFTLPGEIVTAQVDKGQGQLISVEQPAPGRVKAPCQYFGPEGVQCGGCTLQHMDRPDYEKWKHQLVIDALAARGIEAEIDALVQCRPRSRRRAVFSARKTAQELLFGFYQAGTHKIVQVSTCNILSPAIESHFDALRSLAQILAVGAKPFRISVLDTGSGLDVTVQQSRLSDKQRRSATTFAMNAGLARLSLDDEILIELQKPMLDFSGVSVTPPPGAFVQASRFAQSAMSELVAQHLSGVKKSADLFSGCGAFALQMARDSSVHAVESDGASLAALDHAARFHHGLRPVSVERRDLFRRPMQASELKDFGGVVFDPPRAGAATQTLELAKSSVERIAAVSCNPSTLARDLRVLIDGGYRIRSVTPVDQFLWSAHVETVVLLER